jgi:hypothetical protein
MLPPTAVDATGRWVGFLPPDAEGRLAVEVTSSPRWLWPGPKVQAIPGGKLQETIELPAAELVLLWEESANWPSVLRLDLTLQPMETQARLEPLELDQPATDAPLGASLSFDRNRAGVLPATAAELEAPGRLRWSALPPGRYRASLKLRAAKGGEPYRGAELELLLPENGQAEVQLR